MSPILTPIAAVFGIMLLGALVQKSKVLPSDSDNVLNQYVYYVAFPAIMFIALAQTPFASITQWGFIFALSLSMVTTYVIALGLSLWANPKQSALGAIRALNATFGNTAFIGIPLLTMLFPQDKSALVAAAIASLLSVIMFAFALVSIEIATSKAAKYTEVEPTVLPSSPRLHPLMIMLQALGSNPIVIASILGVAVSAAALSLPQSLSQMLHQVGNTSSPCALFAIGMVLTKAMHRDSGSQRWDKALVIELSLINVLKLILQPLTAYALLCLFKVEGQWLTMGVILASLPTAASVYLLAQRYQIHTAQSAFAILISTALTFISLPIIERLLSSGL
ncbi:AEC family transporter [Shewanella sp. SR44-3]|uniref:AEC family transporter n=1 Tax=unclassified Shewanella TaxID=196818 RepID=UPI0015FA1546|nr:AEC family transporter [Shewanella sp. SR44-3]MBB1269153.1 AEC family transporter [Shewanella sp. SR44-3]